MKPIYKWIIKRILTYFLTLYIAITLTFLLFRLIPGNPVEAFIGQIMATRYAEAKQAKRIVEELGGRAVSSVSRNVDYVVVGENPGSKYERAKQLGLKIINEEEFKKLIGRA